MGKIIRNGIIYGVDDNEIKKTVAECTADSTPDNAIVGAKVITELQSDLQKKFPGWV